MRNAGVHEAEAGIKIARRNINNLRYADDSTLMAESLELQSLLIKVKEESENVGLELSIQKTKIMASGPWYHLMGNRWGNSGNSVRLFLGGSKITADGDCIHEIKRLAPWKKSNDQPRQRIKKQRHYFANKVLSRQSYGFSSGHVWMWELDYKESWVPKNWYFWPVVLEKTLESPWTARRSNQSILKEISPGYSLEGLMLKLKTPILWLPDVKNWLIEKDPDAGKDGGEGTTEDEMDGWYHWHYGHEFE